MRPPKNFNNQLSFVSSRFDAFREEHPYSSQQSEETVSPDMSSSDDESDVPPENQSHSSGHDESTNSESHGIKRTRSVVLDPIRGEGSIDLSRSLVREYSDNMRPQKYGGCRRRSMLIIDFYPRIQVKLKEFCLNFDTVVT